MTAIDDRALDSLSVAPEEDEGRSAKQDAGRDRSIAKRLEKNPDSADARLDAGLDESMDASDPPASTQPVHNQGLPQSSGYDEASERERQAKP